MNKAFVRESDDIGGRCPQCGAPGTAVGAETLVEHIRPQAVSVLSKSAYFCTTPHCSVVYYDEFERTVGASELARPVYPKDQTAPICGCFGLTCDDVDRDVADGTPTRVRELLKKAESPDARCAILAADGRCCVAEVRRYYMKQKAAATDG